MHINLGGKGKGTADEGEPKQAKASAQQQQQPKPAPRPFSDEEARTTRAKLIQALTWMWPKVDEGIGRVTLDGVEPVIWNGIDDEDTAFIADYILARAKLDAKVAQQVRVAVEQMNTARLVAILGPRVMDTFGHFREHGVKMPAGMVGQRKRRR